MTLANVWIELRGFKIIKDKGTSSLLMQGVHWFNFAKALYHLTQLPANIHIFS